MNSIVIFLIGLCIGSFLNVIIDRPMQKRSIIWGRSSCDFCHHELAWYDLLPVMSFLFLSGKCRYCHKKLSLQYPLIELLTAFFFTLFFIFLPHSSLQNMGILLCTFGLLTFGIALFVSDIKYKILPNNSLLFFFLSTILYVLFLHQHELLFRLVIAFFSMVPFLLIFIFSKGKGMGLGDVKLIFVMGFLLGFPQILVALYVAFLTGAIAGIILILEKKIRVKGGIIAFGPFLLLGTFIALIWGNTIWNYARVIIGF